MGGVGDGLAVSLIEKNLRSLAQAGKYLQVLRGWNDFQRRHPQLVDQARPRVKRWLQIAGRTINRRKNSGRSSGRAHF
jgi:hypothetical protein